MTKLSDLLKLKKQLEQLDWSKQARQVNTGLDELDKHVSRVYSDYGFDESSKQYANIVRRVERNRDELMTRLEQDIAAARLNLIKESNSHFKYDLTETSVITRAERWDTGEYLIEELKSTIGAIADWRWPVVYWEPNTGELTRLIVHGEPFYVIDDWDHSLEHVLKRLPNAMRRKVHLYSHEMFNTMLPDSSIGLAVVWNNWRFAKVNDIGEGIRRLSKKLIPGGYLLFDFNDGDTLQGAEDAEKYVQSFVWRDRVERFLKENKLEVDKYHHDTDNRVSYILARKAGERPYTAIVNKLAIAEKNQEEFDKLAEEELAKQQAEFDLRKYNEEQQQAAQAKLDEEINALEQSRRIDNRMILTKKLHKAMAHRTVCLQKHGRDDPMTVNADISVINLLLAQERYKDANQLYTRLVRHVHVDTLDHKTARRFSDLKQTIENIDSNE